MASGPILRVGDFTGVAGEALKAFRNVTIRSDGKLYHADAAEFAVGYVNADYASADTDVSVLKMAGRKRPAIASGVIAVGDAVISDADGKVQAFADVTIAEGGAASHTLNTQFNVLGICLVAAAADLDEVELEPLV